MTQGSLTDSLGCSDYFSECLAMPLLAEKCSCDRDGLPSLQVAGQQGAYVARMINRGYVPGRGGLMEPFPCRREDTSASSQVHSLLSEALTSCYVMRQLGGCADVLSPIWTNSKR